MTDVIPDVRMVWTGGDHLGAPFDPAFAAGLVEFFTNAPNRL